jgi:hypothetical protein
MRGLWFVFLAACSFSPMSANSTQQDGGAISDPDGSTNMGIDSGTKPPADAYEGPGGPGGPGSDCTIGHGPLIHGGSGCCGPRCGR